MGIGRLDTQSFRREAIQRGSRTRLAAVRANVVGAEGVDGDKKNIPARKTGGWRGRYRGRAAAAANTHQASGGAESGQKFEPPVARGRHVHRLMLRSRA